MKASNISGADVTIQTNNICTRHPCIYTDKKENQISLLNKEIQSGAVAKS
jgi:hypothetical protein